MAMSYKLKNKPLSQIYKELGIEKKGIVRKYLDLTTAKQLKKYVSFKTGTQERMTLPSFPETGNVTVNVTYAEIQAYSKRIKKRNGKRGTRPFERMKADKAEFIIKEVSNYARRVAK